MSNYQEFISGSTSDKTRYIEAWNSHVKQLTSLGMPLLDASESDDLWLELNKIQQRLEELIIIAANEDFKDE